MIPPRFEYHRAVSVDDAVQALVAAGPDARPLAGGQSLIPMLKLRFAEPTTLVDLGGIAELTEIRQSSGTINIGAMATHTDVAEAVGAIPGMGSFAHVGHVLGDLQVRSVGTFVGSLAQADPSGDWPAVAMAHDVSLNIAGPNGARKVAAANFFDGAFTTHLKPGEIITSVSIATTAATSAYVKIADPANGYARAGVCVVANAAGTGAGTDTDTDTTLTIAATGAASQPFRMPTLEQAATGDANKSELEEAASADIPTGSLADREPYRGQLLRVAARRAAALVLGQLGTTAR